MKVEAIQEADTLLCEMIDTEKSVIKGVKLLGLTSKNKRRYLESALCKAVPMYEGAKVNVNHPKGAPTAPRDYQDRLGIVRNVKFREGSGLYGDLHFNPKHPCAEQLLWDAQMQSTNVGMSHNVFATVSKGKDETVIESIERVQSVDVVADPGSTEGLFEHAQDPPPMDPPAANLPALTLETLHTTYPDLITEIRRTIIADQIAASQALLEANLPAVAVDRIFLEAFCAATPEQRTPLLAARRQLVESLKKTAPTPPANQPRSAPKQPDNPTQNAKDFAAALTQ